MVKVVKKKVSELKFAPYNPRKISRKELEKLKNSIRKFGYVEPIVWNKRTGNVVGGNQRLKVLKELGIEEVDVVEVDLDLEKEKALNLALNRISGDWDVELLEEVLKSLDEEILPLTGFDENEILSIIEDQTEYTLTINTPVYEAQGIPVKIMDLYDDMKYRELVKEIEGLDVDEELKEFLKLAATRFIEFRFDYIAEYYAQASEKVKKIFEKLALVIVDIDKAIEEGFVELREELRKLWEEWKE